MPRRRAGAARGRDLLDDAVDYAVDTVFDRAQQVIERMRDTQRAALPSEALRSEFTCVACRKKGFPVDAMEMVHPSNGFGTCRRCFAFMWQAADEKVRAFAKQQARSAAQQPPPGPNTPQPGTPAGSPRKRPWEVLGVSPDASMEEIAKAYKRLAMEHHPDRIPPGAPDGERERAAEMFREVTRCFEVMKKIRQVPTP